MQPQTLRIVFVLSLTVAATVFATLAYVIISNLEQSVGINTYESIAISALDNAQAITVRKMAGGEVMSQIMSYQFPNGNQWPFVTLKGYTEINKALAGMTQSMEHALNHIIDPNEVNIQEYETYLANMYSTQNFANYTGHSDFGYGIWKFDSTSEYEDGRLPDTTGLPTSWNSSRQILTPIVEVGHKTSTNLLWNLYSDPKWGPAIDSMITCSEIHETKKCHVVTDMYTLVEKFGPAALIYTPIYSSMDNETYDETETIDENETKLVGFIGTVIFWNDVLKNIVPGYVSGLTCVISTNQRTVTFEIQDGQPQLLGDGDLHSVKYNKYQHSVVLDDIVTQATASATYTLTVYPTDKMLNEFHTQAPSLVAIGFVVVIAICTMIFFAYDYLMQREVNQRQMIMEMKRRFVRFISHEIRTPLNAVCMGLELLEADIFRNLKRIRGKNKSKNSSNKKDGGEKAEDDTDIEAGNKPKPLFGGGGAAVTVASPGVGEESLDDWGEITTEINENARVSIEVLNDLLNYDKIETQSLNLEVDTVDIFELLRSTVHQFHVPALNRKIDLNLSIDEPKIDLNLAIDESNSSTMVESNITEDQKNLNDLEAGQLTSGAIEMAKKYHIHTSNSSEDGNCGALGFVGDDIRLGQVFRNIISNALKFTPTEGKIDITAFHVVDGLPHAFQLTTDGIVGPDSQPHPLTFHPRNGSVKIRIKDSGVGLTKDQLSRLFGEGVQFDANKLQHGGGSGLGLVIAKGIVEQHGGTIIAESDGVGTGTSFTIELPMYQLPKKPKQGTEITSQGWSESYRDRVQDQDDDDDDDEEEVEDEEKEEKSKAKTKKQIQKIRRRVLVAEDVTSSRKMCVRLLEFSGHEAVGVGNGEEAVQAIKQDLEAVSLDPDGHKPIDSILMDYEMPVLNGPEAAKQIRELGYKSILFGVTGNVQKEDVDYFIAHGADAVVGKPISMKALNDHWAKQQGKKQSK